MNSTSILSRLRTRLDEATAGFYEDSECYEALTDAQREIANKALSFWESGDKRDMSNILRELKENLPGSISSGTNSFSLPSDFMKEIAVNYKHDGITSLKPCYKRPWDEKYYFNKANSLLVANTTAEYFYTITSGEVVFETTATATAGYNLEYIKAPTDISATSVNTLPDAAIEAIIQHAFAMLLLKDGRTEEAMAEYQLYVQKANDLLNV